MFGPIARRLALLNAYVVVATIALVGATTYALLRRSLEEEADRALGERIRAAQALWSASPPATPVVARRENRSDDDGDGEHEGEHEDEADEAAHDLLGSGDTLLYAVDADGRLLIDARGIPVPGLPDPAGIAVALAGRPDTRTARIAGEPMRVHTQPLRANGGVVGAIQAARSQREYEAELRRVTIGSAAGVGLGALVAVPVGLFLAERAMRPIAAAFARQRAFVADASHELRTPLALIRATTELAARLPDATPAVLTELTGVLAEVDAATRLVDDLLLLARLDREQMILRREVVDLGEAIRSAVQPLTDRAAAAGLALSVAAPPGTPVAADPDRLRQVVRILVDNAIAYTPPGGAIAVTVSRRRGRGVVSVEDTGIGVPPQERERVFDRFYRADAARSRGATSGTGLGLAIARAIVLAHGGAIGLDGRPDGGTVVWFALPVAEP